MQSWEAATGEGRRREGQIKSWPGRKRNAVLYCTAHHPYLHTGFPKPVTGEWAQSQACEGARDPETCASEGGLETLLAEGSGKGFR